MVLSEVIEVDGSVVCDGLRGLNINIFKQISENVVEPRTVLGVCCVEVLAAHLAKSTSADGLIGLSTNQ